MQRALYVSRILASQFVTLPYPTKKFTGQTIIVTGSNVGLGLEAARHFVRLEASKVILAVRSVSKGEAAAKSITESTGRAGITDVWEVDFSRHESVKAFAQRAEALERLDVVIANAGIFATKFEVAEDNESTITVNVINTLFLGMLLLPKLRSTALMTEKPSVLTFTGSFVHFLTSFPEQHFDHILQGLAVPSKARMGDRYFVSKLVELLLVRELARVVAASQNPGQVIVSILNPGWVMTNLRRGPVPLFYRTIEKIVARDTEAGSRTLVHAAEGDPETHGQYLSDCQVASVSNFVSSQKGAEVQSKIWEELIEILERLQPGISENI